jgi:hypothetical protein
MRKLVVNEMLSLKLIFTAKLCNGFDWIQLAIDKIKVWDLFEHSN